MSETQTATAVQTPPAPSDAAPPATDWGASLARLDDIMRTAETAANAQRDSEAQAIDTPVAEPATSQVADDEADLPEDESQTPETSPREERQEEPGDRAPQAPQSDQKRYSRKDAARLDNELQETTRRLNETSSRIQHYQQTDRAIISQLAQLTGSDGSYDRLSQRVLEGTASTEERNQVQQMTEWRKIAGPVYRVAQQEVWNAFSSDFSELRKLEGVTDSVYEDLKAAPNPAVMLRRVFDLGVAAGEKRRQSETTRLNAAVTDLRTKRAAEKPAPVPATAGAPTHNGRLIDRMFKADGSLDPEMERRAERGEFLGVDLTR